MSPVECLGACLCVGMRMACSSLFGSSSFEVRSLHLSKRRHGLMGKPDLDSLLE